MPTLKVLTADPGARVFEVRDVTWMLSGIGEEDVLRLADRGGPAEGLEPEICRRVGDASIIKIHAPQGRPVTLTAWKGITSVYEVFYAHRPNDDFIVSDHFRDILAQLPIEERTPADSSVIDHFLFKVVPGTNSYSRNVQRLGSGERLLIDIASGRVETALFHRLEPSWDQGDIADFIDHLDNKFTSVLQPFKGENAIANFFTGGVDSTLVQSYLGNDVTALNLVPKWLASRWDFQRDYAPHAARLLGVELERQAVMGGNFLDQLERNVETIGMPQRDFSLGMYGDAIKSNYSKFIISERADELFGAMGTRMAHIASLLDSRLGRSLVNVGFLFGSSSVKHRANQLRSAVHRLQEDPRSPHGYGAQAMTYGFTDFDVVVSIFGADAVYDRLTQRLEYVANRVALAPPRTNGLVRHLEVGQWINYFCKDALVQMRHLMHAHGKQLYSPYMCAEVVSAVLAVPVEKRYIQKLQIKHLVKRLLKKRVPGYSISQRKGVTGLDFNRYIPEQLLDEVWERYGVPDVIERVVPENPRDDERGGYDWGSLHRLRWHAMTYAVWDKKVRGNRNLRAGENSRSLEWECMVGGASESGRK